MPSSVTISGFKEFADKCEKMPKILQDEADEVTGFAAAEWELRAKQDAPKDVGALAAGISHGKITDGNWDVFSASEYSPYMEWGTRLKVRVPAELSAYAAQFKGGVSGGDQKKFIFAWCKRVGIPPEGWYPVFLSIMRTGVNPHPFFFIQRPIIETQFINDLKQIIAKER